jgi:hypothetical protein
VCGAWYCTPIILAFRRLEQEDLKFQASLGYIVRHCLRKQQIQQNIGWSWLHMPDVPKLGRLKQEDHEFEAGMGYIVRLYQNTQKKIMHGLGI